MKKSYEVIEDTDIVNMSNEAIASLKKGETIEGEIVDIDGKPYLEIESDQKYVISTALAQKLDDDSKSNLLDKSSAKVKASHKKLIYALVGAGAGYGLAHYLKGSTKKKIIFTIGGLGLGLVIEYVNNRKK